MEMESILTAAKKTCGITEEYEVFDSDIIMYINSLFMTLTQIGVGPEKGYRIEDKYNTWSEFIPADDLRFEAVKTYICLKTRLTFDPPTGSTTMQCLKDMIAECEWRLHIAAES